jgi:hypothetical protein
MSTKAFLITILQHYFYFLCLSYLKWPQSKVQASHVPSLEGSLLVGDELIPPPSTAQAFISPCFFILVVYLAIYLAI